jgi:hypothetical protein
MSFTPIPLTPRTFTPRRSRPIAAHALREEARFLAVLVGSAADDGQLSTHVSRLLADAARLEAEGFVDG